MKYESELIKEILEKRGHELPSLHYQSECVKTWIDETKGAYPKLCDYQSEWLNYIVENPIGHFPYETITTNSTATVNNVVPLAYKSAILTGQTLVNLNTNKSRSKVLTAEINNDRYYNFNIPYVIQSNTDFTIKGKCDNQSTSNVVLEITYSDNTYSYLELLETGKSGIFDKSYNRTKDIKSLRIHLQNNTTGNATISDVVCVIGNMINKNIPYFTGMQSVKMPVLTTTGKNLFDINKCISGKSIDDNGELIDGLSHQYAIEEFIKIDNTITVSVVSDDGVVPDTSNGIRLRFYDKSKKLISSNWFSGAVQVQAGRKKRTFTINGAEYLRLNISANGEGADTSYKAMKTIQIENGSSMTTYEPHKSIILSTPSDLELRGIGDVRDELDCLTGEVTERISEIVADGVNFKFVQGKANSEYNDGSVRFDLQPLNDILVKSPNNWGNSREVVNNNRLKMGYYHTFASTKEKDVLAIWDNVLVVVFSDTNIKTIGQANEWLKQNPITIQYELATESIKTVDLMITNQNGETLSEIKPIEGTMNIEVTGTPIPPTAILEIPVEATTQNLQSFIEEE